MARIVYSGLIDNIRGSIGGTTFQSNKHGYTIKKKPAMVVPKSSSQNNIQLSMSQVSRRWRELSSAQRTAYGAYASSFPQYARHNPTSQLTGYEVYLRYNCLSNYIGDDVLEDAGSSKPSVDTLSYKIAIVAGLLRIEMTSLNDDNAWTCIFFISRPIPSSVNFIGTKTRFVDARTNDDRDFDITPEYTSVFGFIPSVGDFVAIDVVLIAFSNPFVLARDSQIYEVLSSF